MNPLNEIDIYPSEVQNLYRLFVNQDRRLTFDKYNTTLPKDFDYYHFHDAFNFFLKEKYTLASKIKERIYSTDRVFYYIYHDEKANDVRIINEKYGCFHGYNEYLSFENIDIKIKECEKEIAQHEEYYDQGSTDYKHVLAGLQQVKEVYASLLKKSSN